MKSYLFFITAFTMLLLNYEIILTGQANDIIIDSKMTFEEAISGTKAPDSVIATLCLLDVQYYSTDGLLHQGQIVIAKELKEEVAEIFRLIKDTKFPVKHAVPIVKYGWSDDESMKDNNTSAFCYRFIAGTTRLSNHSFGRAVDINPFFNPVVYPDGKVSPAGASYSPSRQGTFTESSPIVKKFLELGWRWGHNFSKYADNHHFDKL